MRLTSSVVFEMVLFCVSFGVSMAVSCHYQRTKEQDSTFYVYGLPEGARFSYKQIPMVECAWCHKKSNLNRHHIIPQSADITLKDDPKNIVVLCADDHFRIAHRGNWKHFNPDVLEIVTKYTNDVISAEYRKNKKSSSEKPNED